MHVVQERDISCSNYDTVNTIIPKLKAQIPTSLRKFIRCIPVDTSAENRLYISYVDYIYLLVLGEICSFLLKSFENGPNR